jgi:hypothetical protein
MTSPAAAFHTAQEALLRASAPLAAAMGLAAPRILTDVPVGQRPPYVVIGNDQVLLENGVCADEAEIFATVDIWTRTNGLDKSAQCRAVSAIVIGLLNAALTITGWTVDEYELQSELHRTDPDWSSHATLTFHYLLTQQVT